LAKRLNKQLFVLNNELRLVMVNAQEAVRPCINVVIHPL
jgi:hypothetical protein